VLALQERLGISERRACRIAGQHRSTQRREPVLAADDAVLRARLRELSRKRPRWGYRRAHADLLGEGWQVNRKRVQRIWREEGLRVPQRRRKRQRLGDSTVPADRLRAERPDHVWALDFQFDQTADGRVLKLLHILDEFTREALAVECRRRIDADATVAVLERLVALRGHAPEQIRCDNGPELTANALRDWCRFSGAGSAYIEPGSPWQNPYVESFGSRIRDELLACEQFSCLAEAEVMVEDFRHDYNHHRPHSALGMRAPLAFARAWEAEHHALAASLRSPYGLPPRDRDTPTLHRNNNPPTLTTGGPMNGVRSKVLADGETRSVDEIRRAADALINALLAYDSVTWCLRTGSRKSPALV
jgi:putative transposase